MGFYKNLLHECSSLTDVVYSESKILSRKPPDRSESGKEPDGSTNPGSPFCQEISALSRSVFSSNFLSFLFPLFLPSCSSTTPYLSCFLSRLFSLPTLRYPFFFFSSSPSLPEASSFPFPDLFNPSAVALLLTLLALPRFFSFSSFSS